MNKEQAKELIGMIEIGEKVEAIELIKSLVVEEKVKITKELDDCLLKEFLIEKDVYEEFLYEWNNEHEDAFKFSAEELKDSGDSGINKVFSWINTSKGYDYWLKLAKEFKTYFESHN